MSDYTRQLAEARGIIQARDIRPGDVILSRCPGDVTRNAHKVVTARLEPGIVTLTMDDGDVLITSSSMPTSLVSLAETAELTGYKIGGAL